MQLRIGDNIRLLRNSSRYSLEELSEIIGVSRQTIAKWEANETYPDIENCVKLSTLFKVSLDALVKEPIQFVKDIPNNNGQYIFGVVKIKDVGTIKLPKKAQEVMEMLPGDRLLILGDNRRRIGIVKCEGINDWIDIDEKKEN